MSLITDNTLNTCTNYDYNTYGEDGVDAFVWFFWEELETWSAFIDFRRKKKRNSPDWVIFFLINFIGYHKDNHIH